MFIDKMTSKELLNEYFLDLPEIRKNSERFDGSSYVKDYLWKHRKSTKCCLSHTVTSCRGNRYLGVFVYRQRGIGRSKEWAWDSYHVGFMNSHKGTMALIFYADKSIAVSYSPHFFNRYKERLMKVCDWKLKNKLNAAKTTEDIISIFLSRNIGVSWLETTSLYKDKLHIFAPIPDGVALLQWNKATEVLQANTFITYDMLSGKQATLMEQVVAYYRMTEEERRKVPVPKFMEELDSSSVTKDN